MAKALTKDFTTGSIPKQMLWFSVPFMLSNALQVLYSTVDMVIVGEYVGTAGLSAVAGSSHIVNFVTMVCLGFSNAGQVLIAQALGGNKREEIGKIIGTLFSLIAFMSLVLSAIILLLHNPILKLVNIPTESYIMAKEYLIICTIGLVFTAGYNMVSAVLRGMGDSKRPFMFIGIASFINLVLDLLFTGLLNIGVAGAALATIIGQGVSFIFSIYYLYHKRTILGFDFKLSHLRPTANFTKMILSLGTPMAIQSGFINISMMYVSSLVNKLGVVASATFGVGIRIDDISNKISQGIQFAAMPMVSQNIAAKNIRRAQKTVWCAWGFSAIFTVAFITLYLTLGKELFMLFSDDPRVHEMSSEFIKAIIWMFPALAIMRGSNAFIQGIGNAKLGLVLSILDGVALRIGLSYLCGIALNWGFYGFVLGYGVAAWGCAVPGMIYFLLGKWKNRRTLAEQF